MSTGSANERSYIFSDIGFLGKNEGKTLNIYIRCVSNKAIVQLSSVKMKGKRGKNAYLGSHKGVPPTIDQKLTEQAIFPEEMNMFSPMPET